MKGFIDEAIEAATDKAIRKIINGLCGEKRQEDKAHWRNYDDTVCDWWWSLFRPNKHKKRRAAKLSRQKYYAIPYGHNRHRMQELNAELIHWRKYERMLDRHYGVSEMVSTRRVNAEIKANKPKKPAGRKTQWLTKDIPQRPGECTRCGAGRISLETGYCLVCQREIVPMTWPTMPHSLFRFRGSVFGEDQDNPGFENVIRAIEDG